MMAADEHNEKKLVTEIYSRIGFATYNLQILSTPLQITPDNLKNEVSAKSVLAQQMKAAREVCLNLTQGL